MGIKLIGVEQAMQELTEDIERKIRKGLVEFYRIITFNIPVDTGHLRANMLMDIGLTSSPRLVTAPGSSGPDMPSAGLIDTWKITDVGAVFHDSVEYAIYVDGADGHSPSSPKAPQGFVDPSIAEFLGLNLDAL